MKPPSKNISDSLRGQSPAGRRPIQVSVSKQSAPQMHPTSGEGGTSMPPGRVHDRSVKPYAGATGGVFGNSKV